jgi:hypothetical protein
MVVYPILVYDMVDEEVFFCDAFSERGEYLGCTAFSWNDLSLLGCRL